MAADLRIVFEGDGFRAVYDDALADVLPGLGVYRVDRASHVEPDGRNWTAAMVGGPVLGPFLLRADALAAERAWLVQNRGL